MNKFTTRDRILEAASDVFGRKGFESTTIRDICAVADANVAAINYHFKDKQNLFYKVLALWMQDFVEKTELKERMNNADTPEEKLHVYIRAELSFLCKENDPDGIQLNRARLILQELVADDHDPAVFECHKEVEEKVLFPVIMELIDHNEDPEVVKTACIAATSMTTHYFLMAMDDKNFTIQTTADLDFVSTLLSSFALGGLKAIKDKYNA